MRTLADHKAALLTVQAALNRVKTPLGELILTKAVEYRVKCIKNIESRVLIRKG